MAYHAGVSDVGADLQHRCGQPDARRAVGHAARLGGPVRGRRPGAERRRPAPLHPVPDRAADVHPGVHAGGRRAPRMRTASWRERVAEGQGYVAPDQGDSVLVLLAERDPFAAELAEYLLRTEGFEVILALDAAESRAAVRGPSAGDRRAGSHDLGWPRRGAVQGARRRRARASSRCRRWRSVNEPSRPARTSSCGSRSRRSSSSPRCAICSGTSALRTTEIGAIASMTERLSSGIAAARRRPRRRAPDERDQPGHRAAREAARRSSPSSTCSTTRPRSGPASSCRRSRSRSTRCCATASHSTFFDPDAIGTRVFYDDLGTALVTDGIEGLVDQIDGYSRSSSPGVIVIDSFKAISAFAADEAEFRRFLHDLAGRLTAVAAERVLDRRVPAGRHDRRARSSPSPTRSSPWTPSAPPSARPASCRS